MFNFLKRIFRIFKAQSHTVIDGLEDPIKLTEQGIRDLKEDLQTTLTSLAQAKALLIKSRKDSEEKKGLASTYEGKAVLLLQKAQSGDLDTNEADRLATEALNKKDLILDQALTLEKGLTAHETQTKQLEAAVNTLRTNISKWENELTTLRVRANSATASKNLNKQLAQVDCSGTLSMLEKMKTKVEEDEALATSYGELSNQESSIDAEIDKALAGSTSSDSLEELKAKLKLCPPKESPFRLKKPLS